MEQTAEKVRRKRLAAFDFDSTLIEEESIDEIARLAGKDVYRRIAAVTKEVNEGRLGIREGMEKRAKLLKGVREYDIRHMARRLRFKAGFTELVKGLENRGYTLAIISGGFGIVFDELKKDAIELLSFSDILCNELGVRHGALDGTCEMKVWEEKGKLLAEIAAKHGVRMEDTVAVGDGALDRTMLEAAGFGVCLAGNPVAEAAADVVVQGNDLMGVLEAVLAWDKRDLEAALTG
ncbi:MAG: phosphoserine phosphatase SerB [Candidatus Micrarchaeota archaeon]